MRELHLLLVGLLLAGAAHGAAILDMREVERTVCYDPREAEVLALQQLHSAQSRNDRTEQLRAWRILAVVHKTLADNQALHADAERGEVLARELGDPEAQSEFLAAEGTVERDADHQNAAIALYDQAIALTEQHGLDRRRARIYIEKSVLYQRIGRGSDAMALLISAHAAFEAAQEANGMAQALMGIAGVLNAEEASATDRAKSISYYNRAIDLLDASVYRSTAAQLYHNLGLAYFRAQNYAQAQHYFESGKAIATELKDTFGTAFYDYRLGMLAKQQQHYSEALASIERALPVFVDRSRTTMVLSAQLARAEILAARGQRKESLDALDSARAMLPRLASSAREATYYDRAAAVFARNAQFQQAFAQMVELRDVEQRQAEEADAKLSGELQTRFDVQRRETENTLLRAQQKESDARRLVLGLALALTLIVVGALCAFLIFQVRQKRQYVRLAMRDELTGMPNRRSILEFAELQFNARRAFDTGFCLAIIDIDHFKSVNDRYGHDVGDAVLVSFARACQQHLRNNHRIGRIGGEEFMIIMPGADTTQIPGVFGRLRDATSHIEAPGYGADDLSFSMGAAQANGDGDSFSALFKRADEALYRAKGGGRSRYEIAPA